MILPARRNLLGHHHRDRYAGKTIVDGPNAAGRPSAKSGLRDTTRHVPRRARPEAFLPPHDRSGRAPQTCTTQLPPRWVPLHSSETHTLPETGPDVPVPRRRRTVVDAASHGRHPDQRLDALRSTARGHRGEPNPTTTAGPQREHARPTAKPPDPRPWVPARTDVPAAAAAIRGAC